MSEHAGQPAASCAGTPEAEADVIAASMAAHPAVFIVGTPRSGTSILYLTLQRHPSFELADRPFDYSETYLFVRPWTLHALCEETSNASARLRLYMLQDEQRIAAFGRTSAPLRRRRRARAWWADRLHRLARRAGAGQGLVWRLTGYVELARLYFHHAALARGMKRMLEKTPEHVNHFAEIRATFPAARFVCCCRHPVDILHSYRKRLRNQVREGRDPQELAWLRIGPAQFARQYRVNMKSMLACEEAASDRFLTVRYEDITDRPVPTLKRICAFLGEPFDAQRLQTGVPESRRPDGSPDEAGRILPNPKRWQEQLSVAEARETEDRLEDLMRRLKYDRYT